MKLLVSDYDGTLNAFDYDLRFNIPFIKKFMKNNIFVLNTGRLYESIKREIDKYKIPYHYLSCVDGNLLLDSNNQVIDCSDLTNDLSSIYNLLQCFPNIDFRIIKYQDSILEYELKSKKFSLEFLKSLNDICIANDLIFKTIKYYGYEYLYLCQKEINKSTPINRISDIEKIEKCDIFTIGDHFNDLEMIRDFNGYTLPWGKRIIKDNSQGICLTVASLIKKITR